MNSTVVWKPKDIEKTRMWQFMRFAELQYELQFTDYQALYHWSINEPQQFWLCLSHFFSLNFTTPPQEILNSFDHMIHARWFAGATFNFASQLLSRRDNHPALISINEKDERQIISYQELYELTAHCAEGLKKAGVRVGDRVAAILPNVPYTIIAMLATTSIGAIWSSCSPDFGAQAAIDRLGQIEPKVLFICDGQQYQGKLHKEEEKIQEISKALPSLKQIVICPILYNQPNLKNVNNPVYWEAFLNTSPTYEFVPLPFNHPIYILFSSGTTGKPKCIVHGAGNTLLQHLKELGLHTDINEQDNLFFYTTCGWMMWNWMASVLALGATLTLYEGAPLYPTADHLFHIIDREKVSIFGTSAKYISALEKTGARPRETFALKQLRTILSTGSPLLPKNYDFVYQQISPAVQLSSISGGTDIVSCFALGNPLLPVYRGELQCLGLGMAVQVFDEQGRAIEEQKGELVCTKPFPSMPLGFWQDPQQEAYKKAYFSRFSGVWAHGDYAQITSHQGLIIYGRSDAVLNPGGIRIGTAEIYRQIEKIPEILESVVIGQEWQDDVRIVLFVVLRNGLKLEESLCETIRQTLRHHASPRHVPAKILQVADIPRTISGKIVEVAVRQVVHGQEVPNINSLANPEALEHFKQRSELET